MTTPSANACVGLIGLGLVGSALVERLRAHPWDVIGHDIDPDRRAALTACGGRAVASCTEVAACARLLKPGGRVFFSTINRNPKSYLFAVIGAEYILRLLPRGTHDYARFVRPSELSQWCRAAGLRPAEMTGMTYNPLARRYRLEADCSVNYILSGVKDA